MGIKEKFGLSYSDPSAFYLTSCQRDEDGGSAVPQLIIRAILLLVIIGVIGYSKSSYVAEGTYNFWFIYLTHWGLLMILFTTGFSVVVAAIAMIKGELGDEENTPWYVQVFWLLYNITNPSAFCITIFYWTVLYKGKGFPVAFATHAVNTFIMLVMLFSSTIPSRVLHFYQPCLFGCTWCIFSIIYYSAGGLNPFGQRYIYGVIDWTAPGKTFFVVLDTITLLVALHVATVGLAYLRDKIVTKLFGEEEGDEDE